MLDKEKAKILETAVIDRLTKLYPDGNLAYQISHIAAQAAIITLQEYEKMNDNQ